MSLAKLGLFISMKHVAFFSACICVRYSLLPRPVTAETRGRGQPPFAIPLRQRFPVCETRRRECAQS